MNANHRLPVTPTDRQPVPTNDCQCHRLPQIKGDLGVREGTIGLLSFLSNSNLSFKIFKYNLTSYDYVNLSDHMKIKVNIDNNLYGLITDKQFHLKRYEIRNFSVYSH